MKNSYLGLKDTVREALEHFFAALYPRHFGAEEFFEEEEKKIPDPALLARRMNGK